ncbi:hypothetical protein, partial [Endozoicomonas atrinae]|uniref:hypothetical protein n=1 Tax=Endozoicomonas atrinae TaxID=1333660 RepID=UPI001112F9E4
MYKTITVIMVVQFYLKLLSKCMKVLLFWKMVIPIAFSKSLSCRQLCLGIITMHYLEQMSRRPQLPEGFNDV